MVNPHGPVLKVWGSWPFLYEKKWCIDAHNGYWPQPITFDVYAICARIK
jgi:hypothetical protein